MAVSVGFLDWLRGGTSSDGPTVGDPVTIDMEAGAQRSPQFDDRDGHIVEIIENSGGEDGYLYAVEPLGADEEVYLNRSQFEVID